MSDTIRHAQLGSLELADDLWEGSTDKLRRFSGCGWNKEYVDRFLSPSYGHDGKRVEPPLDEAFAPLARPPRGWSKRAMRVTIESKEVEQDDVIEVAHPTNAQDAAIAYLLDNEERVLKQIAGAADEFVRNHDYWEWMREALGDGFGELEKLLRRPSGWLSLIDFREIRISDKTRSGKIVVGFDCNCAWDGEHGWGVQLAEDRLVDVGHGDVGWNIYEEPQFVEHPKLGKLTGSIPFWKCETELLNQFLRCGWNGAEVYFRLTDLRGKRSRLPKKPPPLQLTVEPPPGDQLRPLEIVFESHIESGPTEPQFQAVEFLLRNQKPLLEAIGEAVKKYATKTGVPREMKKLLGPAYPDLEKLLASGNGWLSLIEFQEVRVTDTLRKGSIVIGFGCNCNWPFDFYRNTNKPSADVGILLTENGLLRVGPEEIIYDV